MSMKEDRILDAATELFTRFGLGKTTVEEITRAARVGKGTVYLYFKNKEELFCAVVRRQESRIMSRVRESVHKQNTAADKLRTFILTRYRLVQEFLKGHHVSLDTLAEIRPEVDRTLREFRHEQRLMIEEILAAGRQAGELTLDDVALVSLAITAMMDALDAPWVYEGRDLRLERKVEVLIRLIMRGIARE